MRLHRRTHGSHFNPRPREEGDQLEIAMRLRTVQISIHALVKRATFLSTLQRYWNINFNPRPREEGDQKPFPLS